jgi:hypothetical protein
MCGSAQPIRASNQRCSYSTRHAPCTAWMDRMCAWVASMAPNKKATRQGDTVWLWGLMLTTRLNLRASALQHGFFKDVPQEVGRQKNPGGLIDLKQRRRSPLYDLPHLIAERTDPLDFNVGAGNRGRNLAPMARRSRRSRAADAQECRSGQTAHLRSLAESPALDSPIAAPRCCGAPEAGGWIMPARTRASS